LRNEVEVGILLVIRIDSRVPNEFHLTQPGLTEKVIQGGGMKIANEVNTPTSGEVLFFYNKN